MPSPSHPYPKELSTLAHPTSKGRSLLPKVSERMTAFPGDPHCSHPPRVTVSFPSSSLTQAGLAQICKQSQQQLGGSSGSRELTCSCTAHRGPLLPHQCQTTAAAPQPAALQGASAASSQQPNALLRFHLCFSGTLLLLLWQP